jgi:hypothetical protein
MIFLTFSITGGRILPLQNARYESEKERSKLVTQAHQDASASPGSQVWIVDVTGTGVEAQPLGATA